MPDISMCFNYNCILAKSCYRSSKSGTIPNQVQTFFSPKGVNTVEENCDYYWPLKKKKNVK